MITGTKPLYQFQRDINYLKHIERLKNINNRSATRHKSEREARPWVKQSFQKQTENQQRKIEEENEKLLEKLVGISTKSKTSIGESRRQRDNPYRKNWLKSIKKQNQELGDKLLHLRSSLEYNRFSKSIEDYEKVKRSMMINRKAKLPQIMTRMVAKKSLPTEAHCEKTLDNLEVGDITHRQAGEIRYKTETNQ